jgi:YD repeat-containing protein
MLLFTNKEIIENRKMLNMRAIFILRKLTIVFLLLIVKNVFSQVDLRTITPLSPNAAEMAKYGEVPVDNFTGVPSIGIPLYNIVSGDLKLPLGLSYHAGGNKVEAIAGWVGLSWTLTSLPSITRSVNGIPDENAFFDRYRGLSARALYNQLLAHNNDPSVSAEDFFDFMAESKLGTADCQPDIFGFNIGGKSGKFYYNQDLQKFVVTPFSNIQVTYSNGNFTIVSDDGTRYYFSILDAETTTTQSSSAGTPVVTSWNITSIQNVTGTETIHFDYVYEQIRTESFTSETRYQVIAGNACEGQPHNNGYSTQLTTINTRRLDAISFRGGYVKFIPASNTREDLYGGHALDAIKVFTDADRLVKHFSFNYKYIMGYGTGGTYLSNKWMLLTQLKEMPTDNSTPLVHSFEYNESYIPPTRNSMAQDYWGYYNGALGNTTLVPKTLIQNIDGTVIAMQGANRAVAPLFSKFAILNKISYPTGGYTEFEFDNNRVTGDDAPAIIVAKALSIDVSLEQGPGEELPVHKVYTLDFTINNPPNQQLNFNNVNGGAFIDLFMDGLGVPEGNVGASVILKGMSSSNSNIFFSVSSSFKNHYLPNGNYQIVATFDQNPPNYQNFVCQVEWNEKNIDLGYTYGGGLRIDEIRTYDGIRQTPLIKKYLYVTDLTSGACSGALLGNNNFTYFDYIFYITLKPFEDKLILCSAPYARMNAFSNQAQVTHSGAYVGYKNVFVQSSSPERTGYSSYSYTFQKDNVVNVFPYPPASSAESFRGQLLVQEDYEYIGGVYQIARRITNIYTNVQKNEQSVLGLKIDPDMEDVNTNNIRRVPYYKEYELFPTWSELSETTERIYDKSGVKYIETITSYSFDNVHNQLTETSHVNSDGKVSKSVNYYPYDLSFIGEEETARNWLLLKNVINIPLKQDMFVDNSLVSSTTTGFKNFDGNNLVQPWHVRVQFRNSNFVKSAHFDKYNSNGKLLQQHKENDVSQAYYWGYNNSYPVAQVINASPTDIYYTGFEEGDGNSADNDCKTGHKSKTGGFSATVTGLTNGTYVLSYWQKSGNNWVLQKGNAIVSNNSYSINLTGQIDEVRLYPANAQMITFMYDPLIGMTGQCDANNGLTYYEYDGFGRLSVVKDQDGNIIKTIDYHYRNN